MLLVHLYGQHHTVLGMWMLQWVLWLGGLTSFMVSPFHHVPSYSSMLLSLWECWCYLSTPYKEKSFIFYCDYILFEPNLERTHLLMMWIGPMPREKQTNKKHLQWGIFSFSQPNWTNLLWWVCVTANDRQHVDTSPSSSLKCKLMRPTYLYFTCAEKCGRT